MRSLTERRLRSMIRNILRESDEEDESNEENGNIFSERDYTDKALGMKLIKMHHLIKPFIKWNWMVDEDKNFFRPTRGTERRPYDVGKHKTEPLGRENMQKIIDGIISIFWLDDEEYGVDLGTQIHFAAKDQIKQNYGKFTLYSLENLIYEWLTGEKVKSYQERWSDPSPVKHEPRWMWIGREFVHHTPRPDYNTTQLDIMGQTAALARYADKDFNFNKIKPPKGISPKQAVAELQRRIERLFKDKKSKSKVYSIDKAFHDASGHKIKLEDIVPDGTYVGRQMFKTQEQFEQMGEYLNHEFKTTYDYEYDKAIADGQDEKEAHTIAMQAASDAVERNAEAFGLTKQRPVWWK